MLVAVLNGEVRQQCSRAALRRIGKIAEQLAKTTDRNGTHNMPELRKLGAMVAPYKFQLLLLPGEKLGCIDPVYVRLGSKFPRTTTGEGWVISNLFEFAHNGLHRRLRRCAWCKKWFYARIAHQTHCTGDCQKDEVRRSAKWKEYRKEKSKQYYWDKKSGRARRET